MTWALTEAGELHPELQSRFVELIYDRGNELATAANELQARLEQRLGTDAIFESVDGILIAAARISAVIKPVRKGKAEVEQVRTARRAFMSEHFGDRALEVLHERTVRHRVEHFDEYLEETAVSASFGAGRVRLVGPRNAIEMADMPQPIWERHFDPATGIYSVLDDETVNIREIVRAGERALRIAQDWLQRHGPTR